MIRLAMFLAVLCSLTQLLVSTVPAAAQPLPACTSDDDLDFAPEFLPLQEQLGDLMGIPSGCPYIDDEGDVLQETTTGLAVYFTADSVPAFTTGTEVWLLTPDGLLYLAHPDAEAVLVPPPAAATAPPPSAAATPPPGSVTPVAAAVATGRYECYAFSGGRLTPRPGLAFAITGDGHYTDVEDSPGTFSFDPGSQVLTFRGGALDGQRAYYHASRTPRQIAFLTARGDLGDTCDNQP